MKSFLYSTLLLLVHITVGQIDLSKSLQLFGSWGDTEIATNGTYLQASMGEAIVFNTNTRFTQGFNQPNDVVCLPVSLANSTSNRTLCDGPVELTIDFQKGSVKWLYNSTPIQGATDYSYNPIITGNYSAQTIYGDCEATSETVAVNSILDELEVKINNNNLESNLSGDSYQWYISINNQTYAIYDATNKTYTPRFKGRYKVEVKDNPCYGVSESTFYGDGTGLQDAMRYAEFLDDNTVILQPREDNTDLNVYPNPSHGTIVVAYNGQINQPMQLKLFDLLGQELSSEVHASTEEAILTINQPAGVYILQSTIGNQTFTQKLIIE